MSFLHFSIDFCPFSVDFLNSFVGFLYFFINFLQWFNDFVAFMLGNLRTDWKTERQWQENDRKMTENHDKKNTGFWQVSLSWIQNILWFFSVMFLLWLIDFLWCFHDSSVWCVMFNCFFPILLFLFIWFLHFFLFFATFPWFSSLFGCVSIFRWLSSRLHWFSSIVSKVFFTFSLVLADFSLALLLSC